MDFNIKSQIRHFDNYIIFEASGYDEHYYDILRLKENMSKDKIKEYFEKIAEEEWGRKKEMCKHAKHKTIVNGEDLYHAVIQRIDEEDKFDVVTLDRCGLWIWDYVFTKDKKIDITNRDG